MDRSPKPARQRVEALLTNARKRQILVVGDLMLDQYLYGEMETSNEPPMMRMRIDREEYRLGGAGNVAHNLAGLGASTTLIALVGDNHRRELDTLLSQKGAVNIKPMFIRDAERPTTIKTRYVAGSSVEFRGDRESRSQINGKLERDVKSAITRHAAEASAVIVSDYQKGFITRAIFETASAIAKAQTIPLFADPKMRQASFYRGVDVLTPNQKEASHLVEQPVQTEEETRAAGEKLFLQTQAKVILLTRGRDGMMLFEVDREPILIPTAAKEVFDVVGAGDTVIAVLSLMRSCGATFPEAATIANIAAGIVVGKMGTATVTPQELLAQF